MSERGMVPEKEDEGANISRQRRRGMIQGVGIEQSSGGRDNMGSYWRSLPGRTSYGFAAWKSNAPRVSGLP